MSDAEVADVLPFLDDARAEVREMAAEGIAGYTATPEGTAALTRCDNLYPRLVALLSRAGESGCGGAAAAAAAASVNLAQQPAERLKLIDTAGVVDAVALCIGLDDPPELAEYASMCLSNLTQLTSGVELLLANDGAALGALIPRLAAAPTATATAARFAHVALVLTNSAQDPRAREVILGQVSNSGGGDAASPLLEALCDLLNETDETLRSGLTRCLRNLCFAAKPGPEAEAARALLMAPSVLHTLIMRMSARLGVTHASYTEAELAAFPKELTAALGASYLGDSSTGGEASTAASDSTGGSEVEREPRESDVELRLALTEALLLLTSASEARAAMRKLEIYPVLREAHLGEPETSEGIRVRMANEQLVETFYLSEEAMGSAPSEPPRITEEEPSAPSEEVDD